MKLVGILLLPALVSFGWPLATMLFKRRLLHAQLLLSMSLMLAGMALVLIVVFLSGLEVQRFVYDYMFELVAMLCGPMYYIGICSLTEPRGVTLAQRWVFAIPLLFMVGLTICAFVVGPVKYEALCDQVSRGDVLWPTGNAPYDFLVFWDHVLFCPLLLVVDVVLMTVGSRKLLVFQRRFNEYYADRMGVPRMNIRGVLWMAWLFLPLGLASVMVVNYRPPYVVYILAALSVLIAVVQFLTGRFVHSLTYDARYVAQWVRGAMNQPSTDVQPQSPLTV